jgi:hypothetical protein
MCCASCAHRQLVDTQARRRCAIREEKVKPNQVCSLWQMNTPLKLVGIGAGMIKRREYLLYYTEQRVEEQRRRDAGEAVRARKTETIRKEFERNNCSIYFLH